VARSERAVSGTRTSTLVTRCQVCDSTALEPIFFAGYLPPVNEMPTIGQRPIEQPSYPAEVLRCPNCELVQLGLIVDATILFPPSYPYTSGTTRILRENFTELCEESLRLYPIQPEDLVVDIGSNDGTLLSNFLKAKHRVVGIEPTDAGDIANAAGIPTLKSFFDRSAVERVLREHGAGKVITATNVFAHMENLSEIIECVLSLLDDDGLFITESHYWLALLETLQYDTIYHEHLRYYSLTSLIHLLEAFGLDAIRARRIRTHGGSIRVYAARKGRYPVDGSISRILAEEREGLTAERLAAFRRHVTEAKLGLYALLLEARREGHSIYGVGAPSRSATLINYVGLDEGILDCVVEIKGSHKIGKYVPGTVIPVVDESKLFEDQPAYALLLSWHIADELIPKLAEGGFRGSFIVPLPKPRIVTAKGG
jgi:hypothetical protein